MSRYIGMDNWLDEMTAVCDTARAFNSLNVIDIHLSNGSTYEVYVALSKQDRANGLSSVSYIDIDGMLFIYDAPSLVPFTVANMKMDIQVAWYSSNGRLIKTGNYKAGDQTPLFCPEPFSYVLEAPINTIPNCDLKVSIKENHG